MLWTIKKISVMKTLTLLLGFFIFLNLNGQNIQFNDSTFKQRLIEEGIDTNFNDEISIAEAEAVTYLNIAYNWPEISDIIEISYFVNLDTLLCGGNNLTSIDVSNNSNLKVLDCAGNYNLDTLLLGNNASLEQINLDNVYTENSFDFSGLPNLKVLRFSHVNNLDVSNNLNLEELLCDFSSGPINVSNNPNLIKLICKNQEYLDVSNNPLLEYLECEGGIYKLSEIDLSNNTSLKKLVLWFNNISQLDLSQNTALEFIDCSFNLIQNMDFTNNVNTRYISCGGDSLQNINVTGLVNLETLATGNFLDSTSSNLMNLDVSTNASLKSLYCPSGNLTVLNLSANTQLEKLYCGYNDFDTLLLCSNTNLEYLHIDGMPQLTHVFIADTTQPPNYYAYGSPNFNFADCTLLNLEEVATKIPEISIYPNPANDKIYINNLPSNSNLIFKIIDLSSNIIKTDKFDSEFINISSLPTGIYIIQVADNKDIIYQTKLLKIE